MNLTAIGPVSIVGTAVGVVTAGALLAFAVFRRPPWKMPWSMSKPKPQQAFIRVDLELDNVNPTSFRAIVQNQSAATDADNVNLIIELKRAGAFSRPGPFHTCHWDCIKHGEPGKPREPAVCNPARSLSDFMQWEGVLGDVWESGSNPPSHRYELRQTGVWDVAVKVTYEFSDESKSQSAPLKGVQEKAYRLTPRARLVRVQSYQGTKEFSEFSHWELEFVQP